MRVIEQKIEDNKKGINNYGWPEKTWSWKVGRWDRRDKAKNKKWTDHRKILTMQIQNMALEGRKLEMEIKKIEVFSGHP